LVVSAVLNAIEITGMGYGKTQEESLKNSLSTLSNRISVEVKSELITITASAGSEFEKVISDKVSLSSNLPIKGAKYKVIDEPLLTTTIATISTKYSLASYVSELKRLEKNINDGLKRESKEKNKTLQYDILNILLNDIENFNKHKIVATFLKGKNLPTLKTTLAFVKAKIKKLQTKIPSIKIASKILSQGIKQKAIFIYPIKIKGSNEITQFAKVLKDLMSSKLNTTNKPIGAEYFLRGNYEVLKNSIFVTMQLSDKKNNILKTLTATLSKSAYKNLNYKVKTKTFDESINNGFVKSGKLFVNVGFRGYNRDESIDLVGGDIVDIVVKTNKEMCYFMVGHVLKENEKFSYLLPIGSDGSLFINRLSGSDINKNITVIDEVPITKPYGSENLQLMASTFSKNGKCLLNVPKCEDDEKTGLCIIGGKPSKVVSNARALNVGAKKTKVEKAEASISWTSFKK
jgi:hypothetical protein